MVQPYRSIEPHNNRVAADVVNIGMVIRSSIVAAEYERSDRHE
jgi:hypothetical protein